MAKFTNFGPNTGDDYSVQYSDGIGESQRGKREFKAGLSTTGQVHESFPPQGRSQPAYLGSQSSVPDKDVGEPESGRINN